jgi:hypothetical protein
MLHVNLALRNKYVKNRLPDRPNYLVPVQHAFLLIVFLAARVKQPPAPSFILTRLCGGNDTENDRKIMILLQK